jgi:hypothetical protein
MQNVDGFRQCDVCGRYAHPLHFVHLIAYGIETYACDACTGYDPEAYDDSELLPQTKE